MKSLHGKMRPLETAKKPFDQKVKHENDTTWLIPKLVGEVKFTEWTSEGEIRHPWPILPTSFTSTSKRSSAWSRPCCFLSLAAASRSAHSAQRFTMLGGPFRSGRYPGAKLLTRISPSCRSRCALLALQPVDVFCQC